MLARLKELADLGLIRQFDFHFAKFIDNQASTPSDTLALMASLLSHESADGHICIDLNHIAGQIVFNTDKYNDVQTIRAANIDQLISDLKTSGITGTSGDFQPLILADKNRLYLGRYHFFQRSLATNLLNRTQERLPIELDKLKNSLDRLFPNSDNNDEPDWQKLAAAIATLTNLTVISGGPGTGKTTTITKILLLLTEHQPDCRIALAAPTGKAAARLSESLKQNKEKIGYNSDINDIVPDEALTIHRLLGARPGRTEFRHDKNNRLHLDLLIVDEVSMVDLPLMSRLVEALPDSARLILVGDKDQLSSVEAGSVMGDICGKSANTYSKHLCHTLKQVTGYSPPTNDNTTHSFGDHIVLLQKSYRFDAASGIGRLAQAINQGDCNKAIATLRAKKYSDVQLHDYTDDIHSLARQAAEIYSHYMQAPTPIEALMRFNRFRILCLQRQGAVGVNRINSLLENIFNQRGLIKTDNNRQYAGRPLLITRNDYNLELYNGDIGIILPDPATDSRLRAFFMRADGTIRKISPSRLPPHETVYAMTIHKSQGSEFDKVFILAPQMDTPMLTRELIYTAVTRAKKTAAIYGTEEILKTAIKRETQRASGLEDALWG